MTHAHFRFNFFQWRFFRWHGSLVSEEKCWNGAKANWFFLVIFAWIYQIRHSFFFWIDNEIRHIIIKLRKIQSPFVKSIVFVTSMDMILKLNHANIEHIQYRQVCWTCWTTLLNLEVISWLYSSVIRFCYLWRFVIWTSTQIVALFFGFERKKGIKEQSLSDQRILVSVTIQCRPDDWICTPFIQLLQLNSWI